MSTQGTRHWFAFGLLAALLAGCGSTPKEEKAPVAAADFATIQQVLQHPRCQNCHIPGDAPLQFDAGLAHEMQVVRGPEGKGARGLPCATCHGVENSPASYGKNAPPGAPNWALPPPEHKMVFIGLDAPTLCAGLKNTHENGGKDLDALLEHVASDKLVLWGWSPGGTRAPVSVPHADFVAAFTRWTEAGGAVSDLSIRALEAGDKSRWDVLWAGYLAYYQCELPSAITELNWRRLVDPAQQPYGFAALDGERMIGFVHYHFHLSTWSETSYCYLEDLFVDPRSRGHGAGRALIETVYRTAAEKRASRVYWLTRADNKTARTLYDKVAELTPFVQYRHGE